MRREPVPHAYRVFFRHIGIDPDDERTPVEAAALERLRHGGFRSAGVLADALLLAVVETGVPVWALDDERVHGRPRRAARGADRVARDGRAAPTSSCPAGWWWPTTRGRSPSSSAPSRPAHAPTSETTAMRLFSVQAPGVPGIHVEEALWTCTEALDTP